MPANYYCADNFFKKMTDLESPRKNNDCYFYYYSTCTKGDACTFRHEPSALGCETVCSFWKEGKCLNVHCNFRHMELRKNRKTIQCYWETQPGGCKKPHCPFQHQNTKADIDAASNNESDSNMPEKIMNASEKGFNKQSVDSLVVNFEEESDNESAPSYSPSKPQKDRIKTLEELKLERIQAEAAAYYSYPGAEVMSSAEEDDLRARLLSKMSRRIGNQEPEHATISRKRSTEEDINSALDEFIHRNKKQKVMPKSNKPSPDLDNIKVKSLAELRAERQKKMNRLGKGSTFDAPYDEDKMDEESEVSSTSKDDGIEPVRIPSPMKTTQSPRKKIKLKRTIDINDTKVESSVERVEDETCRQKDTFSDKTELSDLLHEKQSFTTDKPSCESDNLLPERNQNALDTCKQTTLHNVFPLSHDDENMIETTAAVKTRRSDSNKTIDESILLLEDDDDLSPCDLKEEELLNEIDDILDE